MISKYAILTPTGRDINMMIQIHNQLHATTRFICNLKKIKVNEIKHATSSCKDPSSLPMVELTVMNTSS